jgi:hypothetical protein
MGPRPAQKKLGVKISRDPVFQFRDTRSNSLQRLRQSAGPGVTKEESEVLISFGFDTAGLVKMRVELAAALLHLDTTKGFQQLSETANLRQDAETRIAELRDRGSNHARTFFAADTRETNRVRAPPRNKQASKEGFCY